MKLLKNMIQCRLNGRMGNQMFQYAICRSIAEKNGYNFFIPGIGHPDVSPSTEGHHILNFFPDINMGIEDGVIRNRYIEDHTVQRFDERLLSVPDFTHINGFFQTEKYHDRDKVRTWFNVEIDNITKSILDKYNNHCFIHLRGTDYKNHTHWFLSKDYYQNAMDKALSINPNISFVIITDDIQISKEMFPDIDCIINDMMVDFRLIYFSKYSIISNSTFSWWASWLGNKDFVIAPDNWLNHNKPDLGFYPVDIKTNGFIYI